MNQPFDKPLDIREVARRTGLTSRALRFYEARGLIKPLRTHSGRRLYGRGELERIHQILALKRAGLSLAQIGKLAGQAAIDLPSLVEAQLDLIDRRKRELDEARTLLVSIRSRLERGEAIDAATFCSLIRKGDRIMQAEDWKNVTDRYFSSEERGRWAERMELLPTGFDQAEYDRKWKELGARVQAAIPLGPGSPEAQALLDEWRELLEPFSAVATPEMMASATDLYQRMDEWHSDFPQAPFTPEAFRFIQEVNRARKTGG
jgi:DNA-binding transcriptional MerR regulator